MQTRSLADWLNSEGDPDFLPTLPKTPAQKMRFLSDLSDALRALPLDQLEKSTPCLADLPGDLLSTDDIVQALDRAAEAPEDPRRPLLIGESALDLLILDERWEDCIPRCGRLIDIARSESLTDELAILFNYRGVCFYRLGRYLEARDDLNESLSMAERVDSNRRRARARINLGLVYKDMGQLEEAAAHYKIALKLAKDENDLRTVLACYINIGNIYRELMRWHEGSRALESGIELAGKIGETKESTRARLNLGVLLLEEGRDLESSARLFREVIDEAAAQGAGQLALIARLNLGLALVRLRRFAESLEESQKVLDQQGASDDPDLAWRAHANMARAYRGFGNAIRGTREFCKAFEEFDRLWGRLQSDKDRSEFQRNLQTLQAEYVIFGLESRGPQMAFPRLARCKSRALGKTLRVADVCPASNDEDKSLLASIQSVLKSRPGTMILDFLINDGKILVFACDSERITVRESPVSIDEIEKSLKAFMTDINLFIASREYRQAQAGKYHDPPEPLRKLGEALLGPVRDRIQNATHLVMVPMGLLHGVPFLALVDDADKYLIETHSVSIIPSSDFTIRPLAGPATEGKVVALKGADEGLAGAKSELESLMRVFGTRLSIVDLSVEASDGSPNLPKILNGADIIHFAGHAEFDESDPFSSALLLPGGARLSLTDLEASGLNLQDTRLVMLAACETGKGEVVPGDELIGIGRGFLAAGADSVVASLWKVSDDVVAAFVAEFYLSWLRTSSSADSLREAALAILGSMRVHPYFFAPFQAYG